MNTSQWESALTKILMLLLGGLAARYGFSTSELQDVSVDASTGILGIAAVIMSHKFHATAPTPPSSAAGTAAKLLFIAALLPVCFTGCAYLNSTTRHETKTYYHMGTNTVVDVVETTHGRAWTFMDANSSLTKFRNGSSASTIGTNTIAPGTYASGINESSSGSNAVAIASAVINAAVSAAINAAK